jgi:methyl-accepting chemotaxis protein
MSHDLSAGSDTPESTFQSKVFHINDRYKYSTGLGRNTLMRIKQKIWITSVILISLLLTREGVNWYGNRSVIRTASNAYMLKSATMHFQGIFRGLGEFIIDKGEPLSIELTEKNLAGFEESYSTIKKHLQETEFQNIFQEKIDPQWMRVKDGVESFIRGNPHINADDDNAMLQYDTLLTESRELLGEVEMLAKKTQDMARAAESRTEIMMRVVAAVILTTLAVLLFSLYRSIMSPIDNLNEIAAGFENGDLSIEMNDKRRDEFGKLASHFNRAIAKLSSMIAQVKEVIGTITKNSKSLTESSVLMAQNAGQQSSETSQAASATEELSSSFIDVATNTSEAAESAKTATNSIFESADVITQTVDCMVEISESVVTASGQIEKLGKESEQISEIVKVIDDIAGQTNLLALNAAIEAARAGEQGRGFAVVADEVRKLAERTSTSTKEIADMVKKIQSSTGKTVESMHVSKEKVENGVRLSSQAGNALQMITINMHEVTGKIQQIAAAAEQQSTVGESISSHLESLANLAKQTAQSSNDSSNVTNQLNGLVLELQGLISGFRLRNSVDNEGSPDVQDAAHEQFEAHSTEGTVA